MQSAFHLCALIFLAVSAVAVPAQDTTVKPAPQMPEPTYVETNGIRMGVYQQGTGIPVVLCHGFPELAYSWRKQMKPLANSGFHVIAPDQRGYGLTDRPDDVASYSIKHLCDDMAGMLDALEIPKAVFIGHDWGGGVVWSMARLHPNRCLGIIGVNTPGQRPPGLPPVKRSEKPLIKYTADYYVNQFQAPGRAEAVLEEDVERTFRHFLTRGDIWDVESFRALPEDSPERTMNMLALLQREEFPGEQILTKDELSYFVHTFEVTGFTGGLNWYRNAGGSRSAFANAKWTIEFPCLYIGAENDVVLRPSSADGMEDFINDFERHTVMDCGHWTQQEKPEEFNRVVIDWLGRKINMPGQSE